MTEISLIVTLNNQFHLTSPQLMHFQLQTSRLYFSPYLYDLHTELPLKSLVEVSICSYVKPLCQIRWVICHVMKSNIMVLQWTFFHLQKKKCIKGKYVYIRKVTINRNIF